MHILLRCVFTNGHGVSPADEWRVAQVGSILFAAARIPSISTHLPTTAQLGQSSRYGINIPA